MTELGNSKIKTENSIIDNVSMNDVLPVADQNEQVEEVAYLYEWAQRRIVNQTEETVTGNKDGNFSFYMFKLDSLHHLPYKMLQKSSKVYSYIFASLVDKNNGLTVKKVNRGFKLLEESNTFLFDMKESLYYYYYSEREKELYLKVEITLCEEYIPQQEGV